MENLLVHSEPFVFIYFAEIRQKGEKGKKAFAKWKNFASNHMWLSFGRQEGAGLQTKPACIPSSHMYYPLAYTKRWLAQDTNSNHRTLI